jgi:hypothetical protein
MNPVLAQALIAERVRDRQATARQAELARRLRRTRHRSRADHARAMEGQPGCSQAAYLRSA